VLVAPDPRRVPGERDERLGRRRPAGRSPGQVVAGRGRDRQPTAVHVYLTEGRPSLLACFDEVVATCTRDIADWRPIV
jgi:hypothetical protein